MLDNEKAGLDFVEVDGIYGDDSDNSGCDRDSGGQALVRDRHQRPQFIGHRRFLPFLQLRQ